MNTGHWKERLKGASCRRTFPHVCPRVPGMMSLLGVSTLENAVKLLQLGEKMDFINGSHPIRTCQGHGLVALGPVLVKALAFLCSSQLPPKPALQRLTQRANTSPNDERFPGYGPLHLESSTTPFRSWVCLGHTEAV